MSTFYRQAHELNPADFYLLNEWALEQMRLGGDYEAVKNKLDLSLELHPEYYGTFDILGDLNTLFHKPEQALAAFQKVLALAKGEKNERSIISETNQKIASLYTIYERLEPSE